MWLVSIATLIFFSCAYESSGAPEVLSYQDGVPRAVGSFVTVVSEVSDLQLTWEIVLYAKNSTPGSQKVQVGYMFYDGPADTNTNVDRNKDVKYLQFSLATYMNNTWTILWNFSFLPKEYNGLILETTARASSQATVKYSNQTVLQVTECPKVINNATAVGELPDPCGYGCTSEFQCLPGFQVDTSAQFSDIYNCTIAADWSPNLPNCAPMSEPTTTEITTTPSAPTTSNGSAPDANTTHYTTTGSTTGGGRAVHPNSGPCLAGIGGGLAAVCIGIFVYMAIITNEAAVIAGIVLGSFALAGMVVVIGFQISLIKSHKGNGIPGKPEDSSL